MIRRASSARLQRAFSGLGIVAAALALAACSGAGLASPGAPRDASPAGSDGSIVLAAGDDGLVALAGGRYRISWDAGGCSRLTVAVAPTSGAQAIVVPVDGPTGAVVLELPAGPAYVNRGALCSSGAGYTVRLERA